jgi:hypothetical protein
MAYYLSSLKSYAFGFASIQHLRTIATASMSLWLSVAGASVIGVAAICDRGASDGALNSAQPGDSALAAKVSSADSPNLPTWPNADAYWGALVNVNQYITTYLRTHPNYFSNVKLATDLEIVQVDYKSPSSVTAAQNAYSNTYSAMTRAGIMGGTYISGTNVMPKAYESQYPYSIVPKENMPTGAQYCGVWPGQTWRQFVCNSDTATMDAFHANITDQWRQFPAPIHFVDNAASQEGGHGGQSWSSQCENMKAINQIAKSLGSRAIFNISMVPGELSDADMSLLMNALQGAGVAIEQPWQVQVRSNPTLTANAVRQYRQLLDSGIAVVMIETNGAGQATLEQLKSWVLTWRKPGDALYLSQAFWQDPDPAVYFLK